MEALTYALDQAVRATGVPLLGVSIGDPNDRTTWRAELAAGATAADQMAADAAIAAFDIATVGATVAKALSDVEGAQKAVIATIAYIWRVTHAGLNPTTAQVQAELVVWKAIYRALS